MITDDKNVNLAPDVDGETAKNKIEKEPTVAKTASDEAAHDEVSVIDEESSHDEVSDTDEESSHDEVSVTDEESAHDELSDTDEESSHDEVSGTDEESAHDELIDTDEESSHDEVSETDEESAPVEGETAEAEGEEIPALPDDGGEAPAPTDGADGEAEDTPAEAAPAESPTDEVVSDEDTTDGETVTEHADVELTEAIEEDEAVPDEGGEEVAPAESAPVVSAPEKPRRERKPKENGSRRVDGIFDFIELFVFTLAVVLFISAFFVRHSVVEGDSMLGTLHSGENLLISDFMYEPERGDVVVVEDLSTKLQKPIIKRVIAVGGDRVRITREGVLINGETIVEEYVFTDGQDYIYDVNPSEALRENETLIITADYYEFVVPEGELFVMGDHRNKSTDSREIGTVDADAVLGRVILRLFPFDKFGKVD